MRASTRLSCIFAALCTSAAAVPIALAQTSPDVPSAVSTAPVAFVYVSNNPKGSSTNEIVAFAAAANGKLTSVPGSPFRDDVTSMAVNGKYLFASTRNGIYVAAFAIESDGALRWTKSTNIIQYNQDDCGSSGPLLLDHTGASLYDIEFRGDCANNVLQSFSIQKSTGLLHNLGGSTGGIFLDGPLTFTGNNVYAYTFTCVPGFSFENDAYKRSSSGLLSGINFNMPIPAAKKGAAWCISYTAADPANHLATTFQPVVSPETPFTFNPDGPAQIATYTVDASGNLTTTSTRANMPATAVGTVIDINMAPSGKLLAVGGTAGLQVFHFNGGNPATHYTGLLTNNQIDQFFWDNANHLYAIGASKLFVFTVTSTSFSQAPGSPYTIGNPQGIIVQPRTPRP
jgi:hypothetical protein